MTYSTLRYTIAKHTPVCLALFALAAPSLGQGQPSTTRSRAGGLEVLAQEAGVPNGFRFVVHGAPGAAYLLAYDTSPASIDLTVPVPGILGNLSLSGPIFLTQPGLFTVPPGQTFGVIGPAGTQTVTSTFNVPPIFTVPFFWQAFFPTGPVAGFTSNPQTRVSVPTVSVPSITGYTPGSTVPGSLGFIRDVEQADVDQDGDLDTFVLYQNSVGLLYLTVGGATITTKAYAPTSPVSVFFPSMVATASAEFVDLDGDAFPDLVVGGSGTQYISVAQNAGLAAPGVFTVNPPGSTVLQPQFFNVNDVETADTDADGDRDVGAATGLAPCVGEMNLHLRNTSSGVGSPQLTDVTLATMPRAPEDTEDMEFIDYDGDGDLDMVLGNFDGPPGIEGQNFLYTNDGTGNYSTVPRLPIGLPSETLDVIAVDIDLDGLDDLYFANWLGNPGCGLAYDNIQTDQLWINQPGAGFVNASNLLPDNPMYMGPTPFGPWTSIDAEAVNMPADNVLAGAYTPKDYDHDGDVDIFIALGSFGNPNPLVSVPSFGINRGIVILRNLQADGGGSPGSALPPFQIDSSLMGVTQSGLGADYNDIELGDWFIAGSPTGQWYEKDVGGGTINEGHFVMKKN